MCKLKQHYFFFTGYKLRTKILRKLFLAGKFEEYTNTVSSYFDCDY